MVVWTCTRAGCVCSAWAGVRRESTQDACVGVRLCETPVGDCGSDFEEEEEEEVRYYIFVFNDVIEGPRAPAVKQGCVTKALRE
jgi:hypothetical protein